MPTYLITAPDGRKFNVTGPGTAEEALAHIQQQFAAPQQQSGPDFSQADSGGDSQDVQAAYARANPAPDIALADVGGQAVQNLIPSAKQFGSDMLGLVMHPIETGKNIIKVGAGAVEKLIPGQQAQEPYADAMGKYFADRYGGWENIKRTAAKDPVGFLADASTVLSGGSALAPRAAGLAGTTARVASTVGRAVDPINAVVQGGKMVAKGVGKVASSGAGVSTGAGGQALEIAAKAGAAGGEAGKTFRANMRGNVPLDEVIGEAKGAVAAIKTDRQSAYNAGMADLSKDRSIIDFRQIDNAINSAKPIKQFTGPRSGITVSLQPSVQKTAGEIKDVIDQWRNLPPDDFHTPEGLDALKQRIGDIRDAAEKGSPAEALGTQVYNIVKSQILKQAPAYAKTMDQYRKASELIREIEGTLSLGRNARLDSALRKLQSVLRNNVNTNYGKRLDMVKLLQDQGAPHLLEALAGQAMSSIEPRGLARVAGALGGIGTAGAGVATMNPAVLSLLIGQLIMQSPRLLGEAAHVGGRVAGAAGRLRLKPLLRAAYETRTAGQERIRP